MAKRKKKLTIFTKSRLMADGISAKLERERINHTRQNIDGTFVFRPTRAHQIRFKRILKWLQDNTKVQEYFFN